MRIETYRGINFRLELTETSRRHKQFSLVIDTSPTDVCYSAVKRDVLGNFVSRLAEAQTITTGDDRFDRDVLVVTDSRYLPAASYFQSQDSRAAVSRLLHYCGCSEIERTRTSIRATTKFLDRSDRPDLRRLVELGIPQIAVLAGEDAKYVTALDKQELEIKATILRMETFLDRKNQAGAALVGFLGALAPLAYFHIGGWRWGAASVVTLYLLYFLVLSKSPAGGEVLAGALFPAVAWKAYVACGVRNQLVSIDGRVSVKEFGAFANAGVAMADLLLGSCMGLVAGVWFLFFARPILDEFRHWGSLITELFPYVLVTIPSVWLVEFGISYLISRFAGKSFRAESRFLNQLRFCSRWSGSGLAGDRAFPKFLPTSNEALRATSLTFAVPISMVLLGVGQ